VKFFRPLLLFLFHLGYFGPLVMGVMDSSFLFLPFGNDLLVVGLVAQHRHGVAFYVISAAVGSTLGALALALAARKIGEEGIRKMAGEKRFNRLRNHLGKHLGVAVGLGALAPPPFPYTLVIAAASALNCSLGRILTVNFFARAARFTVLAFLALKFGRHVLRIAQTAPFRWTMVAFIFICLVGSALSIWNWVRKPRHA
jgi:membrane protein YqaA with SNARE-associated domain